MRRNMTDAYIESFVQGMRSVNRFFKTVQRRAIMFGATSCCILQSAAPAITGSWSDARTTTTAGRTQWPRVHLD
jgi:hypothetical protein